jgi:hypothetical protein
MSRDLAKTAWPVAALALLLEAMAGSWTLDTHAESRETCLSPLVYLGEGRCACKISLWTLIGVSVQWGRDRLAWLLFLPGLPLLSTLLVHLGGERRWARVFHLAVSGLVLTLAVVAAVAQWLQHAAVSLVLWGIWLCAAVAVAALACEVLAARRLPRA